MSSMNVSLTPALMKMVRAKVKSGMYNNASEVIRDALRQLDTNAELIYQMKLERLKSALAPGVTQIENGEVEEFTLQDIMDELDSDA